MSSLPTKNECLTIPKAWGHEEIWALVPGKYCGKRLFVKAGHRLSLQYHQFKDETMMLESGTAYLLLGETLSKLERIELRENAPVHVPPGWVHRLCAVTDTVVLETSTDELDDVFRMDDDYGR